MSFGSTARAAYTPVASFTKEVNLRLAKCPLIFNERLANCGLSSLVKDATDDLSCGQVSETHLKIGYP